MAGSGARRLPRISFIDHTAELGGAEIWLSNLLAVLDRTRWQVSAILWEKGPLTVRLQAVNVAVVTVGMSPRLRSFRRDQVKGIGQVPLGITAATFRQVILLYAELRRSRCDLVHANSLKACVIAGLAGRLAGVPVIWQIHSIVSEEKMRPEAVRLLRRLAAWLPAHVICNSQATAACFPYNKNMSVIPCGINSTAATNINGKDRRARVGMLARFSREKGQHVLIDAAERLSLGPRSIDWTIAGSPMFGDDEYEADIRARAQRGAIAGQVRFMGFVEDVPSLINRLDIVVHPSVEPEGLGQTVIEAMMAGKPVVVSAAGGSAELVHDRVTGRLVPPGDAAALAAAIDDLLANPAAAAEMGRRAREVALERYDIRKTTRAIEDVYEKVLARA